MELQNNLETSKNALQFGVFKLIILFGICISLHSVRKVNIKTKTKNSQSEIIVFIDISKSL